MVEPAGAISSRARSGGFDAGHRL